MYHGGGGGLTSTFFRMISPIPRIPRIVHDLYVLYYIFRSQFIQISYYIIILYYIILSASFARVLIIYVHRLRVCYGFNYCYYVVINYHSVGSQRVCVPMSAEADGRFTRQRSGRHSFCLTQMSIMCACDQ